MSLGPAMDSVLPRSCRVASAVREDPETVTLQLVPHHGCLPPFRPGQFAMLYAFGVGEAAISMSGNPSDFSRRVHTIRAVGAVSAALAAMDSGSTVGVRGPFGTAWPLEEAQGKDVIIVAGGLGLAPLRPAIYDLLEKRGKYGRASVLVGMRNPSAILYRDELVRWKSRLDVALEVTVDHADASWHGNVGVVPALIPRVAFEPNNTIAMVCGPEIMMRYSVNALHGAGIPLDRIYLSIERNMKCAVGYCGHCQFGPNFVCKDGPVMRFDRIAPILSTREM